MGGEKETKKKGGKEDKHEKEKDSGFYDSFFGASMITDIQILAAVVQGQLLLLLC